jgi:hypothetical protein
MDPVHHPVQPSQRNNIAHTGCRDDISPPMSLILIFTWEEKEKKFFFSVLLFVSFERD